MASHRRSAAPPPRRWATVRASSSSAASGPAFVEERAEDEGPLPWWHWPWWGVWGRSQLLDERALLLTERLEPGTYTYTYLLRAGVAGQYHVIPAEAREIFFPEVFGRSAGGLFTIEAKDLEIRCIGDALLDTQIYIDEEYVHTTNLPKSA